mmetsp:Transcript_17133/g.39642  ORF Transcript_17133/g.39642 Transcript_17133/m.39642 type:complete len:111 (-) Transcript_17133:1302-1634(-)
MDPVKRLCCTSKCSRDLQFPTSDGIVPTKKAEDTTNCSASCGLGAMLVACWVSTREKKENHGPPVSFLFVCLFQRTQGGKRKKFRRQSPLETRPGNGEGCQSRQQTKLGW